MGKRGPQKTPTATLSHRGSWLAKTRNNEPFYANGMQTPPEWLESDAIDVWNELGPKLKNSGVLTVVDVQLFARYCQYWVLWKRELQKTERNESAFEKYANQCHKLERELGLTPASRASLVVNKESDSKDKFLRVV